MCGSQCLNLHISQQSAGQAYLLSFGLQYEEEELVTKVYLQGVLMGVEGVHQKQWHIASVLLVE